MGLQRKCFLGDIDNRVEVNVYDIATKKIVFSGSQIAAGFFIGVSHQHILYAARQKSRIKKKYAVRLKSSNAECQNEMMNNERMCSLGEKNRN